MVPRPTLQKELNKEEKDLGDDINALNKKVWSEFMTISTDDLITFSQSKYLEKEFNNAQAQLRDIVCTITMFTPFLSDPLWISSRPPQDRSILRLGSAVLTHILYPLEVS